jgi:hypothetical protein
MLIKAQPIGPTLLLLLRGWRATLTRHAACRGGRHPGAPQAMLLLSARCREYLIGPALVDVLRGKVGLVGTVIPADPHVPLSQGVELLQPVRPLGLTLMGHEPSPAKERNAGRFS